MNRSMDKWDAKLYDHHHGFVSKFGSSVVELLAPKKGERILDVGCGTGILTKELYDREALVVGIDKSENMVHQAKLKFPEIPFYVKDIIDIDEVDQYDAVFSNATLHWVKQPKTALQCIYQCLKPNGRFVAEFGGKGNVATIVNEIIKQIEHTGIAFNPSTNPWYFPSIGEYTSLMEEVGFRVTVALHFDRPTPLEGENGLENWIQMFGGYLLDGVSQPQKESIIKNVESTLRPILWKNGYWEADYKRIRVVGMKE